MESKRPRLAIFVEARGMTVEVAVNGVPMARSTGAPLGISRVLNPWVHTGKNQITVQVDWPRGGAPKATENPPLAGVYTTVSIRPPQAQEPPVAPSYAYVWPPPDVNFPKLPAANDPELRTFEVTIPGLGPWQWESAPPVPPSPAVEVELAAAFGAIYQAFAKHDVAQLMTLSELRNREQATALGMPADAFTRAVQNDWEQSFADGLKLQPLPAPGADGLKFIPCGEQRLYLVRSLDNEPALSSLPDDQGASTAYECYLSLIKGRWTWVR